MELNTTIMKTEKQELQDKLTELDVEFHHKSGVKTLQKLLDKALGNDPTGGESTTTSTVETFVFNETDYRKATSAFTSKLQSLKNEDFDYLVVSNGESFNSDPQAIENLPKKAACLSLDRLTHFKGQWTGKKATKKGDFWLSSWVDNNFIIKREALEDLNWEIKLPKTWNKKNRSNGVGGYISKVLDSKGWEMYHVSE